MSGGRGLGMSECRESARKIPGTPAICAKQQESGWLVRTVFEYFEISGEVRSDDFLLDINVDRILIEAVPGFANRPNPARHF
jgi:hypothetical protein